MNDESSIQINEKLLKLISARFGGGHVLIVTTNKTLRTNLKKVLTMFNFPLAQITVADTYALARECLNSNQPAIIISSFEIDEKNTAKDLLKLHRENYPDHIENLFITLTDRDASYMKSYRFEHGYDEVFKGQQSLQGYANGLQALFIKKLQLGDTDKLIYQVRSLIDDFQIDKALEMLASLDGKIESTQNLKLIALAYYRDNQFDKALHAYDLVLEADPLHYESLHNSIVMNFENKKYDKASQSLKTFLEHYECVPENAVSFCKILNHCGHHNDSIELSLKFIEDDLLPKEDKTSLITIMQESAKEIMNEDPQRACEIIKDSVRLSGAKEYSVFNNAIDIFIKTSDYKENAQDLFSKYFSNFSEEKDIDLLEYKAYYPARAHAENFQKGMELFNRKFHSHFLYYTLIITGIEIGRSKDALEDIIFSAIKVFPDFKPNYEALLMKIQDS